MRLDTNVGIAFREEIKENKACAFVLQTYENQEKLPRQYASDVQGLSVYL